MREWLNFEWSRPENKQKGSKNPFTTNTMKLVTPKGKLFGCAFAVSAVLELPIHQF